MYKTAHYIKLARAARHVLAMRMQKQAKGGIVNLVSGVVEAGNDAYNGYVGNGSDPESKGVPGAIYNATTNTLGRLGRGFWDTSNLDGSAPKTRLGALANAARNVVAGDLCTGTYSGITGNQEYAPTPDYLNQWSGYGYRPSYSHQKYLEALNKAKEGNTNTTQVKPNALVQPKPTNMRAPTANVPK